MISIVNKKIFIADDQGVMYETSNPELIGLAMLDYVNEVNELPKSKNIENIETLKEKYFNYLKENKFTLTVERKHLIDVVLTLNNFEPYDFIEKVFSLKIRITQATCYNFLQLCVDAGIIEIQPKKYILKHE